MDKKSITKNIIHKAIFYLKLPMLIHKILTKNDLTIISYHGITDKPMPISDWCFLDKQSFREQIDYLKKHFNIVHLSKAVELIKNKQIDRSTAVITFDDGFQNNYDVAYPILEKAGVPATIFLATAYIDTADTIWFCRLNQAFKNTVKKVLNWNGKIFNIEHNKDKSRTCLEIQYSLKVLPHSRLLREVNNIIHLLGEDQNKKIEVNSPYRMLNSDAIYKMSRSGFIEFGAHTHNHTILTKLEIDDIEKEIEKSIKKTAEITKLPCRYFAYPNGGISDYDKQSIRILESLGINAAVTTISGPNFDGTPLMHLRRYGIRGDTSIERFQTIVHHFVWRCNKFSVL